MALDTSGGPAAAAGACLSLVEADGGEQAEGAAWPPPAQLVDISPTCLPRPYHSGRSCFLF